MSKVDIIISGDKHLDLRTEGIDRTDDICNSATQIIDYAISLKEQGNEVYYIDAGDTFHSTRPRAEVIAKAISLLRRMDLSEIPCHVIDGNHDVIDERGRTSALEPVIAADMALVYVYHDIELRPIRQGVNLIALPHISKARAYEAGYKNVQCYIEDKAEKIEESLDKYDYNIILSHLNIAGATVGTEEFMIKGAHEDFPEVLKKSKKISYIFNGHFHKCQLINNPGGAPIIVTGDVCTNDFGERLDRKCFFHLELEV